MLIAPEELLAVRKENAAKLPVGTVVEHKTFGRGVVESLEVEKGRERCCGVSRGGEGTHRYCI